MPSELLGVAAAAAPFNVVSNRVFGLGGDFTEEDAPADFRDGGNDSELPACMSTSPPPPPPPPLPPLRALLNPTSSTPEALFNVIDGLCEM